QGNEVILIRYWLDPDNQTTIDVDRTGKLYKLVQEIVKTRVKKLEAPDWRRDCMFVAVACLALCVLVTNDREHLLPSRADFLSKLPAVHPGWTDAIEFMSSCEAHAFFGAD